MHHALCKPFGEEVAIKRSNLEGVASSLAAITKEATLMHRFRHANVLPLHASFVAGHELWMVMPFLGAGSVRDIMRRHFPQVRMAALLLHAWQRCYAWGASVGLGFPHGRPMHPSARQTRIG